MQLHKYKIRCTPTWDGNPLRSASNNGVRRQPADYNQENNLQGRTLFRPSEARTQTLPARVRRELEQQVYAMCEPLDLLSLS